MSNSNEPVSLDDLIKDAYDRGYIDGITCFAWHGKKGMEVGSCGTTLKYALEARKTMYNYLPEGDNKQTAS